MTRDLVFLEPRWNSCCTKQKNVQNKVNNQIGNHGPISLSLKGFCTKKAITLSQTLRFHELYMQQPVLFTYSYTLKRGSFIQKVSGIYPSDFRSRLTKIKFAVSEKSLSFQEMGPRSWDFCSSSDSFTSLCVHPLAKKKTILTLYTCKRSLVITNLLIHDQ